MSLADTFADTVLELKKAVKHYSKEPFNIPPKYKKEAKQLIKLLDNFRTKLDRESEEVLERIKKVSRDARKDRQKNTHVKPSKRK